MRYMYKFACLLALFVTSTFLFAQADSVQIDSLDKQIQANLSEQEALSLEIAKLKQAEDKRKEAFQASLDSLMQKKALRDSLLKQEVNSGRKLTKGTAVVFDEDTLFRIYAKLGPFSPKDRADNISGKLEQLFRSKTFDTNKLKLDIGLETIDLLHDSLIVLSVTDFDSFWANKNKMVLANEYKAAVVTAGEKFANRTGVFRILMRIGTLILASLTFFFLVKYLNKGFNILVIKAVRKSDQFLKAVKIKNYEVISKERSQQVFLLSMKVLKWLVIALVVYLSLPTLFSIFPQTKGIATTLFGYVLNPVKDIVFGVVSYIPELVTIVVILVVTHYFVRFLGFLAKEIEVGNLQLPGFYSDWAHPTFNLLKIILYAFSFVIIFPYLPGSDSAVFQGVSVFFGLLISLGSSSAIGNIIAGLVITYMRAFKIGDRVKIGEISGEVLEKNMLVTRIRTIKNEEVTIPNASILAGSTVNYTTSAKELGLVLHSTVTIGYDVEWRKVHELLIDAAKKTDLVRKNPEPYVFQTSLDDFYVSYQINAFTANPEKAAKIYSDLHANIQDGFAAAGIEIMSPHFQSLRDGSAFNVPEKHIPKDFVARSFKVKVDPNTPAS